MTATITYRLKGKVKLWTVGCAPTDDEDTLRKHLEHFIPDAEFISVVIEGDE